MTNDWIVGALYPLDGGIGHFWTQPDGPFTTVYPKQKSANVDYFSQVPFNELSGSYMGVCGHSFNMVLVQREYDYENSISVALLCCPSCGTVQRTVEPFEDAVTGSSNGSLALSILYP